MKYVILLILTVSLSVLGCDAITGASNIDYRVSGSATRVSLTYEAEGGTQQISSQTVPVEIDKGGQTL